MAHRFPLPAEGGIETLIAAAYDRLPGPEPLRVTQIAERLASRRPSGRGRLRPNSLPWWIVILALSGAAAASWWAGEVLRERSSTEVHPAAETHATQSKAQQTRPAQSSEVHTGESQPGVARPAPDDGKVIYERESP